MNKLPEEYCIINATADQLIEASKKYYGDSAGIIKDWKIFNCVKSLDCYSMYNRDDKQFQQFEYLPKFTYNQWKELYYNKEFVLPEKWWIETKNEEEFCKVVKWFRSEFLFNFNPSYPNSKCWRYSGKNDFGHNPIYRDNLGYATNHTKITFEQFKKYVLKEEPVMEKKKYTLEEVKALSKGNKIVVYLDSEKEFKALLDTHLFQMCSNYYGEYCYHLNRGTYSSSSDSNNPGSYTDYNPDIKVITFNQIIFNKPMLKKEEFTIEGSEALKKAFVEESGLNNSDIFWNLFLTPSNVKEKALTCTAYKQYIHFILPSQWDEALEYVKEYFAEDEFKVGDWVIGWHATCKDFKTKAWQIGRLTSTSVRPVDKSDNYGTDYKSVRKATPEEIKAAQIKTFKLGEHTAVVTEDKVEIAGRGSLTHAECIQLVDNLRKPSFIGGFEIHSTYNTIDIGCVKNVPFEDIIVVYNYLISLQPF